MPMAINRKLWKRGLQKTYAPLWPCPQCVRGKLNLKQNTLHFGETAASRFSRSDEYFNIMDVSLVFSALLECIQCGEVIACCGRGGYEPEDIYEPDGNISQDYNEFFVPQYFSQPLLIFRAPAQCPQPVKEQLRLSFGVFFCDLGAAANQVRSCIEEILTDLGIDAKDSQGKLISLHNRIEKLKSRDPENADRALALKWIGNFGSHPGTLTKNDLLDAYEILDMLLEDLYVGHLRSIRQKVADINLRKGPSR